MPKYTVTYDNGVQGFPSFYTFYPEQMVGMNNFLYSFKGGNIFRHNTNSIRNNFYGVDNPSIITSVFNDEPLDNKIFKTLALESDDSWDARSDTDQQNGNFIEYNDFELKEGCYHGHLRAANSDPASVSQYALRSANGIGNNIIIAPPSLPDPAAIIVNFSISPVVSIGNILSVGDLLYTNSAGIVTLIGVVTDIVEDYPNGDNYLVVDTTIENPPGTPIGSVPSPSVPLYFLFIKNGTAESHGILGHYNVFTLTNNNVNPVELFFVESEVMKSFP